MVNIYIYYYIYAHSLYIYIYNLLILCMWLSVCLHKSTYMNENIFKDRKKVLNPLKLELQTIICCHMTVGYMSGPLQVMVMTLYLWAKYITIFHEIPRLIRLINVQLIKQWILIYKWL